MNSDNPIGRRQLISHSAYAVAVGLASPSILGGAARGATSAGQPAAPAFTAPVFTAQAQAQALRVLGRDALRVPGSLPFPQLPAGTDTMPGVQHIVVLMLENHSFDNFFGMLGRGDGFTLDSKGLPTATNPYPDGKIQQAFRMPTTCQLSGTPSQEWLSSHAAYNNGKNDGFVSAPVSIIDSTIVGGVAMGYWTGDDLPFTYSLASTFPIGDRWFCSMLGQTDPNRRYLIAATSAGMTDDGGLSEALIPLPAAGGTVFNLLDSHGIGWENYVASYPTGATPELFVANDAIPEELHHTSLDDFFTAAANGTLPSFSLLDPDFGTQSQENPQNIVVGEALLAQVVQALGNSPLWEKSILLVMYDEHGGYFDHVPPPPAIPPDGIAPVVQPGEELYEGFARYGFRVPSVVVSPYAKPDYVSHLVYDQTSVLAFVERKWNLPALTYRDANANDLTDFLDLGALASGQPTFPRLPKLAAPGDTPARLACSTTGPGTIPPPDSIS